MRKGLHRIVIPTLSICLGAAIVGSISGTVAWYQYSTRVSTAYLGTTAGTSGNLKLRIKGTNDWVNSLTAEDIETYLTNNSLGTDIIPITAGNMTEDSALGKFYKNPVRSLEAAATYNSGSWLEADDTMYVQIPLELCYVAIDGEKVNEVDKAYLQKDVYISELLIQADYQNRTNQNDLKEDLSSAIRVHISSYREDDNSLNHIDSAFDRLISKEGGTILTKGYLDLDGVDGEDTVTAGSDPGAKYGFGQGTASTKVVYGEGIQTAYKAATTGGESSYLELDETVVPETIYPAVVKTINNTQVLDEDDFEFTKNNANEPTSKSIGHTIAYDASSANFEQEYLQVVLTIWLEGWQTLPAPTQANPDAVSAIWDAADYIGSMFDVGIQFAVQAE